MVNLFQLGEEVTAVRMEVVDTIETCETVVIGEDHAEARLLAGKVNPRSIEEFLTSHFPKECLHLFKM